MDTLRITGVQMAVSPKLDENLPRIVDHIARSDADYIVFPEMSLTGYHGDFGDAAVEKAFAKIAAACRQAYVTALIGTGCREGGKTYIQTRIFGPDGEVAGTYEKIVPTEGDRAFCTPGEELPTFQQNGLLYGCLICNDLWVTPGCGPYPDPRLSYQLGKKGAQLIFHAVNSGTNPDYTAYHESNLALRARESGVHIVVVNAASHTEPVNCRSGIVSPQGAWLVHVPTRGEHVFHHDLSLDLDESA